MKLNKAAFASLLFALCFTSLSYSQIGIGEWRSHMTYSRPMKAVETSDRIYCAGAYGLYYLQKSDNSITTLSKVDGLSGVELVTIDYDPVSDFVFVSYLGGAVDMLGPDMVVPVPFVERADILGDKTVYNFTLLDGLAYMATNFGVVVYDIAERQIKESYLNLDERGNQLAINDIAVFENEVYISTPRGLRVGNLRDNLLDFSFWQTINEAPCEHLQVFEGRLIVHFSNHQIQQYDGTSWEPFEPMKWAMVRHLDVQNDHLVVTTNVSIGYFDKEFKYDSLATGSPSHGMRDEEGVVWVCSQGSGLVKFSDPARYITPNGPGGPTAWDFDYANGELWVASGGVDNAYNPRFLNNGVYKFNEQKWTNFNGRNTPTISSLRDLHLVRIDPSSQKKYVASYYAGLIEFDAENEAKVWDRSNTEGAVGYPVTDSSEGAWILFAGMDIDDKGNLWISQQYAQNQLVVKGANDRWASFDLGIEKRVTDVMVDHLNQKWVIVHLDGMYVFRDGGTPFKAGDDSVRRITQSVGNGQLPAADVYCMATDREGDIWIGTGDGVGVIYRPDQIFSGENFDAQKPLIQEDGALGYLLEGQKVNCITVDGANQKWFGTDNGLFVTNEDGDEIIYRFNESNSPLLSDVVRQIEIDTKTGEAFIATDKGIISYRAVATEGGEEHEGVYAFPNPVRPGYEGVISITGLVENAVVKITDISGNLVYETNAQGGTAIWEGNTFGGRSVSSGVYLAFSSDRDGEDTYITKIMIIR